MIDMLIAVVLRCSVVVLLGAGRSSHWHGKTTDHICLETV